MALIQLKVLEDGSFIDISKEKITVGRGPHLKIVDKRVSRNHATLEINEDGQLILVPIHVNPCFLKKGGEGSYRPLQKDKPQILNHKDVFGLLQDAHAFEVLYKSAAGSKKGKSPGASDTKMTAKQPRSDGAATANKTAKLEMAMPIEKTRKLPKWMLGAGSRVGSQPSKSPSKTPTKPRVAKTIKTPEKQKPSSEFEDDEESLPVERKVKGKRKKKETSEEEEQFTTRRPRAAARKPKYEDFVISDEDSLDDEDLKQKDDSDFVMEEDSDSNLGRKKQKGKGKISPTKRRGARKSKKEPSDSEDDLSEEDYSPSKRKARGTGARKGKKKMKKNVSDSDSDSEQFDNYVQRPSKKKARKAKEDSESENDEKAVKGKGKKSIKKDTSSDESDSQTARKKKRSKESDSETDIQPKKKTKIKKASRKNCSFGDKCYRKNPKHFEEFCHPGDDSYSEEEEEDERPRRAHRAMTKKDKLSALHGASDDDGDVNTYDYKDSFLDDGQLSSAGSSSFGDDQTDSEWEPDDEEDIKGLVKEAKGFMKNKKMVKPSKR